MFNDTVTLYNHYFDKLTRKDMWNRTVLKNCMWRPTVTKSVVDGKIQVDDSISLTIPFRDGYLSPKQYAKLPNDKMAEHWTIKTDSNLDIVVLGEIKIEITDSYTITNLREDYDNVATISTVSDNTLVSNLKHWKVIAK